MSFTHFLLVESEDLLLRDYLRDSVPLDCAPIDDLLRLGAVYVEGVRAVGNEVLKRGQVIRVHKHPKRYSVASALNPECLILQHNDFLVVNKPHGIPVHATLDNQIENLHFQLEQYLQQKLFVTHRLDIPTGGLLLFAKNQDAQTRFNKKLQARQVQKTYQALIENKIELGLVTHYMDKNRFQPKVLHIEAASGRQLCQLDVTSCNPVEQNRFQVTLQLLTGRTQQIRAQLSALGAPICGDMLYNSQRPLTREQQLPLLASRLCFEWPSEPKPFEFSLPSLISTDWTEH